MMNESHNEQWRWEFNRKIAEYMSSPSREKEANLGFMLASYRIIHNRLNNTDTRRKAG